MKSKIELNKTTDLTETVSVKKARKKRGAEMPVMTGRFAALDFETADYGRDSACSLSVVIVNNSEVVDKWHSLIQPPRRTFLFTYLHGISWNDVKGKPKFNEILPDIRRLLEQVDFVAAHNAAFDRSVLRACCESYGLAHIDLPFVCTVKLARKAWSLKPAALPNVCSHLKIPLKHHDAESDSHACAQILLAALIQGHAYVDIFKNNRLKPR
jgi:DNA polymerase-3 subunit epsilon